MVRRLEDGRIFGVLIDWDSVGRCERVKETSENCGNRVTVSTMCMIPLENGSSADKVYQISRELPCICLLGTSRN